MNKEQRKYENYLQALRKQVEKLPTKIWEYSDIEDKSYQDKRNYLLQEVMDIRNKLVVYLEKKYGKNVVYRSNCRMRHPSIPCKYWRFRQIKVFNSKIEL